MEERIQKLMAEAGIGSRRDCEALIEAGRVTVNGHVAHLGEKADPNKDSIVVDGQPLKAPPQMVYIALYKPRGVLSAVDAPDPRPTVRELVPVSGRIYPVGRLDVESEGLILLTNDGDLANRLTHPRYGHEKEYRVLVARRPDDTQLETWRRGVVLEDGYRTQPAEVRLEGSMGKGAWLRIILTEGRKRQIRESGSRIGLPVVKIIRVRLGSLTIGSLKPREWRYLTPQEVAELKGQATAPAARVPSRAGQADRNRAAGRAQQRPFTRTYKSGQPADRRGSGEGRFGPERRSAGRGTSADTGRDAPERGRRPAGSSAGRTSGDRWNDQGRPGEQDRSQERGRSAGRDPSPYTGRDIPERGRRPAGSSAGRTSSDRWNDQSRPGEQDRSPRRGRSAGRGPSEDPGRDTPGRGRRPAGPGPGRTYAERWRDQGQSGEQDRSPGRGRTDDRPAPGGRRPSGSGRRPASGGSRPSRSGRPPGRSGSRPAGRKTGGGRPPKKKS